MTLDDDKKKLRAEVRAIRKKAAAEAGAEAATKLAENVLARAADLGLRKGAAVSGYWPMAEEMDVRPLLEQLDAMGLICCLPVVPGKAVPLIFRLWRPGTALHAGGFNLHQPGEDSPEVRPDVMLAPLLAFDAKGNRIGWGGGYYDRTTQKLRTDGRVTVVGVAFAGQEVAHVPHDEKDQPLDWIATDKGIRRIGG